MTHLGSFHGLTLCSAATSPPAFLTALCRPSGALTRPSSRAKKVDRRVRRDRRQCRDERGELLLLPALDALDDDEAPADGEGHGIERQGDRLRGGVLALEQLHALSPALLLGQRAQPGPPLGDAAVIVTVDEVGGLEAGHAVGV